MKGKWLWITLAAGGVVIVGTISCCLFSAFWGGSSALDSAVQEEIEREASAAVPASSTMSDAGPPDAGPPDLCEESDTAGLPELNEAAALRVRVVVGVDRRARLVVASNLPPGTRVGATIYGRVFMGQTGLDLDRPCVVSDAFGSQETGLRVGEYVARVSTPDARAQPEAVRGVFGEHGQNLRGSQVQRNDGERRLVVRETFAVGDPEEAAQADREGAATARRLRRRIEKAMADGRAMARLRRDPSLMPRCMARMRELQAELRDIKREAERIGDDMLARITGPAEMCVTCSVGMQETCGHADIPGMLEDWEEFRRPR